MNINERALAAKNWSSRIVATAEADFAKAAGASIASPVAAIAESFGQSGDVNPSQSRRQYRSFQGHAYTAISAIAKRLAGQEIHIGRPKVKSTAPSESALLRKAIGDDIEPDPSHPFKRLLADPNPIMVSWSLVFSTIASLNIAGRAYWWLTQADDGKPQLWPLPASWVKPADKLQTSWEITTPQQGEPFTVDGRYIAPFHLPDPENPFGCISPLQTQAASIDADEMLQRSQVAAFANGIKPGVIVKAGRLPTAPGMSGPGMRPNLTPAQRKQLTDAIRQVFAGVDKHGGIAIVDGMIDEIMPYTHAPSEMDWLASGTQLRSRIFSAFGVNPIIVGEIQGANRAQAFVAEKSFCDNVCNPLATIISQTLSRWGSRLYGEPLEVWLERCVPNDREMRIRELDSLAKNQAITKNELRNAFNLPSHPDGDEFVGEEVEAILPMAKSLADAVNPYGTKSHAINGLPEPSLNGHGRMKPWPIA